MRNKTNHNHQLGNYLRYLGYIANMGLGIIALAFLFPFVTSTSSAVEFIDLPATSTFSSTISLSLGQPADIDLTPAASGSFGSTNAKLVVSTSSNAGYQLYINTLDQTSAMTNVYNNANSSITALTQPTVAGKFEANTWGYSISATKPDQNTTYYRVPTDSTIATETTAGGNSDELYLSFAANIDTTLPAGTYANTVAISAIANPAKITNLSELAYMQDMTSSICTNTKGANNSHQQDATGSYVITPGNEVEKRLIDSRDGKEYWVAKLADGNCWMTQNLAYDLVKGEVLTSAETDLNAKTTWTVPTGTASSLDAITSDADSLQSWTLGEFVLAIPGDESRTAMCQAEDGTNVSVQKGQSLHRCTAFQDVSGWLPNFTSKPGVWNHINYDLVAVDINNKTYDSHYLIGNYYQWNAATADTGRDTISPMESRTDPAKLVNVKDSICPRGWQLPRGGRNNAAQPFDLDDSFYRLFRAYGYPSTGYLPAYSGTDMLFGPYQDAYKAPMSMVNAGVIRPATQSLYEARWITRLWAATAYVYETEAYALNVSPPAVTLNHSIDRFAGQNLRCLAR